MPCITITNNTVEGTSYYGIKCFNFCAYVRMCVCVFMCIYVCCEYYDSDESQRPAVVGSSYSLSRWLHPHCLPLLPECEVGVSAVSWIPLPPCLYRHDGLDPQTERSEWPAFLMLLRQTFCHCSEESNWFAHPWPSSFLMIRINILPWPSRTKADEQHSKTR